MKRSIYSAVSLLGLALVTVIAGCGGGGAPAMTQPITQPITVSVSATAGLVQAGGTVQVTADSNDPSGVTWTISPASGAGSLSNMTSASVTYNAPATPPASDVTVTITATSVSDTSQSNFTTIIFAAISVSVSADTGTVQAGGTAHFTATVNNDPSSKGVTSWTISPASGAGTLSSQTNSSAVYNAPATPPASDATVTIMATSVADSSKSGSTTIIFAAISVSLSAATFAVQAGGTVAITATVNNDPSNKGVTSWTISPASGAGTLSNTTGTSAMYNAPASPPASNLAVTITATSVSDSSKSGSTTVTVLAITVSVVPGSALIPVNATQQFTGSVLNDPANQGVTWTVMQGGTLCATGCGTFAPTSTASGTPTTYTAPATVPASATVTLTATSISDTTKSGSAKITLTIGTVKLVPDSLDFGRVKSCHRSFTGTVCPSKSLTTTLTNTASTALSITSTSITITGTNPSKFSQTNTCVPSVGAGASCTIKVTFTPKTTGSFSANVSISDSSADSPQQVSLSGTGTVSFVRGAAIRSALATNKAAAVPSPTGPSPVGTRVMDLIDSAREDPYLASGAKRELLVRFWYPASAGQACKLAAYASPRVWSYFSQLLGLPLPEVKTNSCLDAPITEGAHSIIVFTPGYTGTFTDYTFLFEDLASRGYVVASVDHTYEATAVEFPDGRFVTSVFGSHLGDALRSDEQALSFALSVRLSDLKFVVNELERLNARADSPFAGKLDVSSVALAGHSLGGLTAILGVGEERRFKAGIVIDGSVPDTLANATETPLLILAMGHEQWGDDERRFWGELRGPRLAVNFRGAEHLTPSDAVWLAKYAIKTSPMGPDRTIAAVRDYIAAFLDANLRGKPLDPLLAGPSPDYPDAAVTTQKQLLRGEN